MKMLNTFILCNLFLYQNASALDNGTKPISVTLSGEEGGRLDGTSWTSDEMKGKLHILFYVDPDEKDLNNEFADALKKEEFPIGKFKSVAIINMDATWAPNFAIASGLKKKQEQHPKTLYIKDMKKKMVKAWGLGDDTSVVVLFDSEGSVLFHKDGKLTADETQKVITLIKSKI